MTGLVDRWNTLPRPRLLVLGDLMLDRYTIGEAERVSPEAPVLVLRSREEDVRPGGAANVASFLRGLEADVALLGVIGDDGDGRTLRSLLTEGGIDAAGVLTMSDRPTTSKHRFVGRASQKQPHQLLRVDFEDCSPLKDTIEQRLQREIRERLSGCAALLISDYAKGVCRPMVVKYAIELASRSGIPVLVDPSREPDIDKYCGATAIAPNRLAAERLYGRPLRTAQAILATTDQLRQRLQLEMAVITLDRDGLAYATDAEQVIVSCRPRAVSDVTGAGDMVLSVLGLCRAGKLPWRDSLELANVAAGLEVERFGVEPISRAEVAAELRGCVQNDKLLSLCELARRIGSYRQAGKSIVFTNGCFDLLHVGHVTLLQEAAALGDVLIVAINCDASVRKLKGPERPVIKERDRAQMLAALGCVDHVLLFSDDTPHHLLDALRPDVLVKGGTTGEIVGSEIVEAYGGQVIRLGTTPDTSTTRLVDRIRSVAPSTEVASCP